MRSRFGIAVAVLAVFAVLASPLAAQEKPPTVAIGYRLEVLPGHQAQFETAMKQQLDWYKKNNETWAWHTWRIDTGPNWGQYVFRSPGHHWKDMDDRSERGKRARAHFMDVVRPHLASMSGSISSGMPAISRWPDTTDMFPLVQVLEFKVNYGMAEEFVETIGKIHEAIVKTNWPVHYAWSTTVSGGEGPAFWLVLPAKSWADMAPPDKPFRAMLEEAMSRAAADAILASLTRCVKEQHSMLASFQPELSYMPAKK